MNLLTCWIYTGNRNGIKTCGTNVGVKTRGRKAISVWHSEKAVIDEIIIYNLFIDNWQVSIILKLITNIDGQGNKARKVICYCVFSCAHIETRYNRCIIVTLVFEEDKSI